VIFEIGMMGLEAVATLMIRWGGEPGKRPDAPGLSSQGVLKSRSDKERVPFSAPRKTMTPKGSVPKFPEQFVRGIFLPLKYWQWKKWREIFENISNISD
jgi:hypothetical protein